MQLPTEHHGSRHKSGLKVKTRRYLQRGPQVKLILHFIRAVRCSPFIFNLNSLNSNRKHGRAVQNCARRNVRSQRKGSALHNKAKMPGGENATRHKSEASVQELHLQSSGVLPDPGVPHSCGGRLSSRYTPEEFACPTPSPAHRCQ
ncbi:hypothetical protein AAFF_G00423840 [Aldrovandia affinis]|uniref:Uncharacterized protein n=1 Tax=Aldrovandia affinis TaxID=143900 RepID=A0AAD7T6K7_9TELE|nr:hypothetical protein AAFF_G00423840 [Aldrovandia affinis]